MLIGLRLRELEGGRKKNDEPVSISTRLRLNWRSALTRSCSLHAAFSITSASRISPAVDDVSRMSAASLATHACTRRWDGCVYDRWRCINCERNARRRRCQALLGSLDRSIVGAWSLMNDAIQACTSGSSISHFAARHGPGFVAHAIACNVSDGMR